MLGSCLFVSLLRLKFPKIVHKKKRVLSFIFSLSLFFLWTRDPLVRIAIIHVLVLQILPNVIFLPFVSSRFFVVVLFWYSRNHSRRRHDRRLLLMFSTFISSETTRRSCCHWSKVASVVRLWSRCGWRRINRLNLSVLPFFRTAAATYLSPSALCVSHPKKKKKRERAGNW